MTGGMSQLYVIGYPELADRDHDWIQGLRQRHDPQADLVAPHFTLVFGLTDMPADTLEAHVRTVADATPPIAFVLRHTVIDAVGESVYLYLVPQEGGGALVRLHGGLYTGPLLSAITLGVPFVPHITIGRFADDGAAKAVFDEVRQAGVDISGRLSALAIVRHDGDALRPLATIALNGAV